MKKVIFASAVVLALIGCQQKEPATTEVAPAAAPAAPATSAAPEAPAASTAPTAPAGSADKK